MREKKGKKVNIRSMRYRPLMNAHQESAALADVSQGKGDVEEHDEVAEGDGDDVAARLALQLILNRTFSKEGHIHITRVFRVLTMKVNDII